EGFGTRLTRTQDVLLLIQTEQPVVDARDVRRELLLDPLVLVAARGQLGDASCRAVAPAQALERPLLVLRGAAPRPLTPHGLLLALLRDALAEGLAVLPDSRELHLGARGRLAHVLDRAPRDGLVVLDLAHHP